MIRKVTKFFALLILFCLFESCATKNTRFGTETEIHDSKDSIKGLAKIKLIRNLDNFDFKKGNFKSGKTALQYRLLSPQKTEDTKKYPLILVFHGSGAIGNNNRAQMGILSKMWLLPDNRKEYPAFVLSPQFPVRSSNYHLDEKRNVQASESNEYLDLLLKSVDSLSKTNQIDRSRIYVIGFSMGGSTTSNAISKRPDLFAAAINISGISQFDKEESLINLPIWIVHGSLDTDNDPKSNFKFFEEMKTGGKVFLWKYKDKYHNNIVSSQLVEALPKWLFKQRKK